MNYNDKNKKGEYTLTSNFYKKIVFLRFFWFLANIKNIGKFKRSDFSYFPSINSYYILPLKSPKKIFLQKTRFKFTLLYFGYLDSCYSQKMFDQRNWISTTISPIIEKRYDLA